MSKPFRPNRICSCLSQLEFGLVVFLSSLGLAIAVVFSCLALASFLIGSVF